MTDFNKPPVNDPWSLGLNLLTDAEVIEVDGNEVVKYLDEPLNKRVLVSRFAVVALGNYLYKAQCKSYYASNRGDVDEAMMQYTRDVSTWRDEYLPRG